MKALKISFKVLKYIIISVLLLIIAFFAIYIGKRLITKDKTASVFNISFYEVSSWSMYDYLSVGDLVVVVKEDASEYEEVMVVTYLTEKMNTPATHKIEKREGDIITTRGINAEINNTDDEPFDVKYILGKVKFVWRGFGNFMSFIRSPLGIITILLASFVLIGGGYYLDTKLSKKEVSNNEN